MFDDLQYDTHPPRPQPTFPPGDLPFPLRFALALTLVANGAAVKGRLVATMKHVDLSVEHFLDILMLYSPIGQDDAPFFCVHNSAV